MFITRFYYTSIYSLASHFMNIIFPSLKCCTHDETDVPPCTDLNKYIELVTLYTKFAEAAGQQSCLCDDIGTVLSPNALRCQLNRVVDRHSGICKKVDNTPRCIYAKWLQHHPSKWDSELRNQVIKSTRKALQKYKATIGTVCIMICHDSA